MNLEIALGIAVPVMLFGTFLISYMKFRKEIKSENKSK